MKFLDQLQAPIMVIIAENDEQGSETTTVACTDGHEDLDQILVVEVSTDCCDSIGKDQRPHPG